MCVQRSQESQRQHGFERLAKESHVPIAEVAQLYENEWAKLALGARFAGFLATSLCATCARDCADEATSAAAA